MMIVLRAFADLLLGAAVVICAVVTVLVVVHEHRAGLARIRRASR
jgi:hypothetical protein